MKKFNKFLLKTFVLTIVLNICACSSTLLFHELGHFLLGIQAGCKNIRLVLLDSELGTYTEMNCLREQPFYFALVGAFMLTLPFIFSFLFLKNFPEKNLFWISLGFNFLIALTDFPSLALIQMLGALFGFLFVSYGEMLLIDDLLSFYKGVK